ncbi:MAG: DNA repair protein RecO [Gottschalkiaceae bacterium]|nr:MAG: DNA repair protein RecO [Gottschalkiaceae bacterium]
MPIIKTQGLVLKYTNVGEADRILTLLTRDKGKIKAYAKGCRRPKSSLTSSSEIFAFSDFILFKGTNFYHVSNGELRESFYDLRKDLIRLSYAVYFAELADTVTDEEMSCERILLILAKTLYYLSNKEIPIGILSCAYQLKLMDLSGFKPSLQRCVICGKEGKFNKFSISLGGVLCNDCLKPDIIAEKINPDTLEYFEILLSTPISRLNNIKIDNTIFIEADRIIKDFVQLHLDKKFKSAKFINSIKNFDSIE